MKTTKGLQFTCVDSGAYDNLFTVGKRYDSSFSMELEGYFIMQDDAVSDLYGGDEWFSIFSVKTGLFEVPALKGVKFRQVLTPDWLNSTIC